MLRKYNEFILEKLGVPDGIINSSKILLQNIINCFKLSIDDKVNPDPDSNKCSFITNLESPVKIGDMELNDVELMINIYFDNKYENPEVMSWGVAHPSTIDSDIKSNKINLDKKNLKLRIMIDFISKENNGFSKFINKLESERDRNIGIVSHELKHLYDHYMIGKIIISDAIDYSVWARFRTGVKEIDKFMFYLYLTSKEESLVRSSEIAGELESLSLKKSEFKDFLMKSDLYKNLIEMRDFRFDDMKRNMLKNIDQIKDTFIGIPEDESDQDIIDNILYGVYEDIVEDSSNKMISFIDPDGIKRLIGAIKKEENDFYSKFLKKRFSFKNHDDFFIFGKKRLTLKLIK